MVMANEIERRVEQADAVRGAKRAAAAKRVGELAEQRARVAEQLAIIERELGDVLTESSDVIGIEELAKFTEVPASELRRWHDTRKATRPRRKRNMAQDAVAPSEATPPPLFDQQPPATTES